MEELLPENNWEFNHLYINSASFDEVSFLEDKYNINPLDIEDIVTDTQLSKIELRSDYIYIALQFPRFDKVGKNFNVKELHFLFGRKFFITINKNDCSTTSRFNNVAPDILPSDITTIEYFYEILDYLATNTYKAIPKFRSELVRLEKDIFNFNFNNDKIYDIQIVKRNLINFDSLLKPLMTAIKELQNKNNAFISLLTEYKTHVEKLDDSLDKIKKIISSIDNLKETVNMLSESNEALTARSTNDSIKALTAISLLITAPNIITSFFGMNVYFGWGLENSYIPLIVISVVIVIITILIYLVLKKTKWF